MPTDPSKPNSNRPSHSNADRRPRAACPRSFLWTTPVKLPDDDESVVEIREACKGLPESLGDVVNILLRNKSRKNYDPLANIAIEAVWRSRYQISKSSRVYILLSFARVHMFGNGEARILRLLSNHPSPFVREHVRSTLIKNPVNEVALPQSKRVRSQRPGAFVDPVWNSKGWFYNRNQRGLLTRKRDTGIASRMKLPTIETNAQLCELLKIKSSKQMGYLLLATDRKDGPYRIFEIAKRSGAARTICAPKEQLRWVQRRILRNILDKVPVNPSAHGFVKGRSTVTNASTHVGNSIVIKFDLVDFFPTISFYRVVGLFGSLGYHVGDTKFSSAPDHRNIAPALARLCCYTANPESRQGCFLPQGAPTSPAITNLICRALDARLNGLAKKYGGQYSRYADDLTFSFEAPDVKVGRFRWWVDQICHQEGFIVNQDKFRAIRQSQRQSVTGIVVNDCLRVDRRLRRKMRAIVHNCERNGVDVESRGEPGFLAHLLGVASYIHMIHPEEGRVLLDRIGKLENTGNEAGGGDHA